MIGYHYTTRSNWLRIQEEGLIPQPVAADKLSELLGTFAALGETTDWNRKGIWVWKHRMQGRAHVGSVLFQVAKKGEPYVVLLKVRFRKGQILGSNSGELQFLLRHRGNLERWQYHTGEDSETAFMLTESIPPSNIHLVAEFDITKAFTFDELPRSSRSRKSRGNGSVSSNRQLDDR